MLVYQEAPAQTSVLTTAKIHELHFKLSFKLITYRNHKIRSPSNEEDIASLDAIKNVASLLEKGTKLKKAYVEEKKTTEFAQNFSVCHVYVYRTMNAETRATVSIVTITIK